MTYKAPTGEYITLACRKSDDEKSVLHYQNCKQKTPKNNKNSMIQVILAVPWYKSVAEYLRCVKLVQSTAIFKEFT